MKRFYLHVGEVYLYTFDNSLVIYLGIENGFRHFQEISGRFAGTTYYADRESAQFYVRIKTNKLLRILYGVL